MTPTLPEGMTFIQVFDASKPDASDRYYTADQMRAYAQEAARQERERTARAQQDEIVNAAIEWYGSSHKDEPEHRLAMAVLRFKQALAEGSPSPATKDKQ